MKPRLVLSSVLAVGLFAVAVPGFAQQTNPDVMPANRPAAANNGGSDQGTGPNGPGGDDSSEAPAEKKKPVVPAAGYAYSDKPAAGSAPHTKYKKTGATVAMPGFEQTADGGSRFFVQLSQSVPVEERKANGTITYVMKGASPRVWNNTNALVTVHFSTPVARARLVPQGNDLLFVLDLRAVASATYKINETADKGAQLTIDFPKGDWLNAPAPPKDENAAPAKKTTAKKKK
jgi:hypothetical protein